MPKHEFVVTMLNNDDRNLFELQEVLGIHFHTIARIRCGVTKAEGEVLDKRRQLYWYPTPGPWSLPPARF